MARITLGGDAVAGFPDEQPGEILTLIWPAEGATSRSCRSTAGASRPTRPSQHARNYTIRRYDPTGAEVAIDVVLHGDGAHASRWAGSVSPGDRSAIAGPRLHFVPDPDADYTLLAGDETALPSIAATLERLPAGHRAHRLHRGRRRGRAPGAGAAPRGEVEVEVNWIHRDGAPAGRCPKLLEALRAATLPYGRAKVWVAGESLAVRALREHLRDERGLQIGPMQAIGYWKHRDDAGRRRPRRR